MGEAGAPSFVKRKLITPSLLSCMLLNALYELRPLIERLEGRVESLNVVMPSLPGKGVFVAAKLPYEMGELLGSVPAPAHTKYIA